MKRLPPIRRIPQNAVKVCDKKSDAVAYLYIDLNGRPCARVFYGKQSKPVMACYFRTEEQREKRVTDHFVARRDTAAAKAAYRTQRTAWVPDYKVGDILHTNWGYDQTNVEYFEIVDIKGKYAVLRELAQERTETAWAQGNCVPLPGNYLTPRYQGDDAGLPIRRLMQERGIKIDDVRFAYRARKDTVAGIEVHKPIGWSAYH